MVGNAQCAVPRCAIYSSVPDSILALYYADCVSQQLSSRTVEDSLQFESDGWCGGRLPLGAFGSDRETGCCYWSFHTRDRNSFGGRLLLLQAHGKNLC